MTNHGFLRCLLTTGIIRKYPTSELRVATYYAYDEAAAAQGYPANFDETVHGDAIYVAYDAASNAAYGLCAGAARTAAFDTTAYISAAYVATYYASSRSEAKTDLQALVDGKDLFTTPLWNVPKQGAKLIQMWQEEQTHLTDPRWGFWIDWYNKCLDGSHKDSDWPLYKEIALGMIKRKLEKRGLWDTETARPKPPYNHIEWEDDEQALAQIEAIRVQYFAGRHSAGEDIRLNPATQKLRAKVKSTLPQGPLADVMDRMGVVMDVFDLDGAGGNQYQKLTVIRDMLQHAIERYPDRPQRLHDTCLDVVRLVKDFAKNGDCPEPERDGLVSRLLATMLESAGDIYRNDAEVKDFVDKRDETRIVGDEAEDFNTAAAELQKVTEGYLSEELKEDAMLIASIQTPWIVRRAALYRFGSRVLRIVSWSKIRENVRGLASDVIVTATAAQVVIDAIVKLLSYF